MTLSIGVTRKLVTKPEKHAASRREAAAGRAKVSCKKDKAEAFAENATLLMIAIQHDTFKN